MDLLDESFGAQTSPVDLAEVVGTDIPPMVAPLGAVRNRAATSAMLSSDPTKAVENYQLLMREGEEGKSAVYNQLKDSVLQESSKVDMQGVMSVLGDKNIPFETKQKVIAGVKNSQFLKDSGTILHSNSLAAGSKGENAEQESARLSTADTIREIYNSRNKVQGLVNAHAASLDNVSAGTVGEMAELWVMPFGNAANVGNVNKGIAPKSAWEVIKGYLLPGTTTANIREKLASIPPEQRPAYAQSVIESIRKNSGILFSNDNQFAQFEKASSIFSEGGYSSTQEFLDNVSNLLDVVGLGFTARGVAKGAKGAKTATGGAEKVWPAEWELVDEITPTNPFAARLGEEKLKLEMGDQVRRIEMNSVVRRENPASPANIIQGANPEKARSIHELVVKSTTDEVAEAMYGVSRNQAIINDVMPQMVTESGKVTAKTFDIERGLREQLQVDEALAEALGDTGATYFTTGEKAKASANIINDFRFAEGLEVNDAMSSFTRNGGKIEISSVYGTKEGGFLRAEDALTQAKFALKNYGIRDDELVLLKREGIDYVPVKLEGELGKDGNYLVQVKTTHTIDPTDITSFEALDVKRNFFSRIEPTVSEHKGSVDRYLFDAASMVHPVYSGAASVVSDQSARFERMMLQVATEFSDKYAKLPSSSKSAIDDYIKEANFKGIPLDLADLVGRGFNNNDIDVLKSWRKFWDTHFYLENYDIVKTLNAQGFQKFKNNTTELYAKPIPKNQNLGNLYDPATDSVIRHSKAEGDALYNAGGTYAKLRRPADFGGDTAEYMIVRNTPTEYLRKFRESDQVLNYRPGYYQIQYKAPKFVEEITKDASGVITGKRAIAVAGDTKEAQFFANRMKAADPSKEYNIRGDVRAIRREDDSWWDLNSAGGRIAQRHRGKTLEDASGLNHLGDGSYIVNPVESATRAAKSIGGRVVTRPMLEAFKTRFVQQYKDFLPPNGMGGVSFPSKVSDIVNRGKETGKPVADARTVYEYINYLENGYINTLDQFYKVGLNTIANVAGNAGISKLERGLMSLSEQAPMAMSKNTVFMAYIGTNILRQWIVQPHQVIRTFGYNPQGWATGEIPKLLGNFIGWKMGTITVQTKAEKEFAEFITRSGLLDAVDKQNLIRGTLLEASDSSNKAMRIAKTPITASRKIGFDIGESANILGHAAAVYDKFKRNGKDLLNKDVRDQAYSEIRAISYDMNFAGDFPYNQTSPSTVLQFMQVPHKALLQTTNRRIDTGTRTKLAALDLILWGAPTALIGSLLGANFLPDNPFQREAILHGLESAMMNKMFTTIYGEKTDIDFSGFDPRDMTGWTEIFKEIYTGGMHDLLLNSPSGQLMFKEGSRLRQAVGSMGRFFGAFEDIDETPEEFTQVLKEVAKISSGFNNAYKAKLLLQTGKRYDQYGSLIDDDVNSLEAVAQAFGFTTYSTSNLYLSTKRMAGDVKAHKEEVLSTYKEVKRYYYEKLQVENTDPKFITKVTGFMLKAYADDVEAQKIISGELAKDLQGKDAALIGLFMKRVGIPDLGNLEDQIKQTPMSDEEKTKMLELTKQIRALRAEKEKK